MKASNVANPMRFRTSAGFLAMLPMASLAFAGCSSSPERPVLPGTDAGRDASFVDAASMDGTLAAPPEAGAIVSDSGGDAYASSALDAAADASDASDGGPVAESGSASAGVFVSIDNGLATEGVVYGYPANGGSGPSVTIYPAGVSQIAGMGFDSTGALYLASVTQNPSVNGIAVFPPNSQGASTPTRFITGASTTLQNGIGSMVVTPSGDVYVYSTNSGKVLHFAPTADGDATPDTFTPVAGSTTWAYGVGNNVRAVDPTGSLAYITGGQVIGAFTLGASGDQAPSSVNLGPPNDAGFGFGAAAMTCDSAGNLYTLSQESIFEFGPEPTGMATPVSTWPTPDFTGGSLAVTSTGRVYFLMANINTTATGGGLRRARVVDADVRRPARCADQPVVRGDDAVAIRASVCVGGCSTQRLVPGSSSLQSLGWSRAGRSVTG